MPETEANKSNTLADLLPRAAERFGSDGAFLFKNEKDTWENVSYDEVLSRVRDLTLGLIDLGLEPGDRISILGNTRIEWTLFDFAAMSAGAVVAPADCRASGPAWAAGSVMTKQAPPCAGAS